MNRLIAFGLVLTAAGIANAQPIPTVNAPGNCATCQPGFGDAPCGTPLFPGVGHKPGDRTCWNTFVNFICYKPGPHVMPILQPTPFHAPLRAYYPCKPGAGCAAPCAAPTCSTPAPKIGFKLVNAPENECRKPLLQSSACPAPQGLCLPRLGNGGLFVRSASCSPEQGPACVGAIPRPAPLLSGCKTCGHDWSFATGFGRVGSCLDNLMSCFSLGRRPSSCGTYGSEINPGCTGVNCYPSGVPGPTLGGYRTANPVGYPAPMGAYPTSQAPTYQQQIAAVPFTNP